MTNIIALGTFDGLHAAHRAVLQGANAALLFNEHPQKLLSGQAPLQLMCNEERAARLQKAGIAPLHIPFEEIATLPPEAFFHEILRRRFGATGLRCGHNFRFGANASGDIHLLRSLCNAHGMQLSVVPKVVYQGAAVSSSRIRAALQVGDITQANAMLGRTFGYSFEVVHGQRLGHVLGTPTLNQCFPPDFCVPRFGVYASRAFVDGKWRPSMTNIGLRPTIKENSEAAGQHRRCRSETHILDFDGDLYGKYVPVRLLSYIRDERKFDNLEALKGQIRQDLREIIL